MVSDRFWMIDSIAENPRPTGKCVKYTLTTRGLRTFLSPPPLLANNLIYQVNVDFSLDIFADQVLLILLDYVVIGELQLFQLHP